MQAENVRDSIKSNSLVSQSAQSRESFSEFEKELKRLREQLKEFVAEEEQIKYMIESARKECPSDSNQTKKEKLNFEKDNQIPNATEQPVQDLLAAIVNEVNESLNIVSPGSIENISNQMPKKASMISHITEEEFESESRIENKSILQQNSIT